MAANPMLKALSQSKLSGLADRIAPIKQTMNMIRNAGNPQAMMAQMMQNNPQYAQVMQLVQENGGDAQKAFYALADKLGIDGDTIVQALK